MNTYLDQFLFIALPYAAFVLFFIGTVYRYRAQTFTYSSLSSQFLENRQHFWGLVPFHFGILVILGGHILAFLMPEQILRWNTEPIRLYILEVSALIFGLLTLVGLVSALLRRASRPKIKKVTSPADWFLFGLLLLQIVSGVYVAVVYPWGSSWFAATATPYLWSLATLQPDIAYLEAMPGAVRLHVINAYLMIGFFPFTRLVHILVVPNPYLWRRPQVVRWSYGVRRRNWTSTEAGR